MSDQVQETQVAQKATIASIGRSSMTRDPGDVIALVITGLWLLGVIVFFIVIKPDMQAATPGSVVMSALAIILPIALIWIAVTVLKTTRVMREESARLQAAIDAMRNAYIAQNQSAGLGIKPAVEKKLDEIVEAQKQTQSTIATFATSREARKPAPNDPQAVLVRPGVPAGESQPTLALETVATPPNQPLSIKAFIGALNFPENENDAGGFRQLRAALADPNANKLVRASQDVLTLLSQDGIYMDDLRPDLARPEIWRKFAAGERGRAIATLGGIRDRSGIALAAGRMRSDPIFRDSAHHFLREFDKTFAAFSENASDEDITNLSDTRTARAFMLLGRVAGTFD
ncbi:MAG: hypothetical protein AAGA12_04795 [Pseudomonadota bacterium]